ncbi:MAG: DNA translocase FtsK, partial [Lachnospiraceae bacterium]|nr:DNA translocase FtsK [Lachnospiraceae bacterium]
RKKKKVKPKKRPVTKRKSVKNVSDDRIEIESPAKKVIFVIVSLSIAAFIFLSTMDMCGGVGKFVKTIILSTFGTMGYVFPVVFVCMALFVLFSEKKVSKLKNYSLIVAFTMLISLMHLLINKRQPEKDFIDVFMQYVETANIKFTFESMKFSGGIIGAAIAEGLSKFIGEAGTVIILVSLFVICLVLFTGIKFYGEFIMFLFSIITFIPRMISKVISDKKVDDEIAKENEEIFNEVMEKKIKPISGTERTLLERYDPDSDTDIKNVSKDELEKDITYDTENIHLDVDNIQKRFFHLGNDESLSHTRQDDLLDHMKKESVNEIVYNNKDIKVDDFFYNNDLSQSDNTNYEEAYEKSMNDYKEHREVVDEGKVDVANDDYIDDTTDIVNDTKDIASDDINIDNNIDAGYAKQEKVENSDVYAEKNVLKDDSYKVHTPKKRKGYKFPSVDYLKRNTERTFFDKDLTKSTSEKLVETLSQFGVGVVVTDVSIGPTVTRYELQPNLGVKVSKVLSLQDDIKLALAASDIRIEAPIPGKSAIGIEVPNKKNVAVLLGDLVGSREFKEQKSALSVCIGKDIGGKNIYCDIDKMPHLLVAGATGSGKSVCINSIIMSIIYRSAPKDVRLILVDPKVVELQVYNDIPHLMIPVVTDPNKASMALNWAVQEMSKRYKLFAEKQVKDLAGYNQLIEMQNKNAIYEDSTEETMPRIVIIIDELSDLMMTCGKNVENSIVRLAQLSRACGIHLIIATQRPSVNVVTGLIKANVPSRIAFAVTSGVDSRTILDMNGAEDLLGHGDMLYFPTGSPKPLRVQGCFVSEKEIKDVVDYIKDTEVEYDETIVKGGSSDGQGGGESYDEKDELFYEAGLLCIETKQPSIGLLQRKFRMGFNRAARVIDQLEQEGVVTPQDGKKPRDVIMTKEEFEERFG